MVYKRARRRRAVVDVYLLLFHTTANRKSHTDNRHMPTTTIQTPTWVLLLKTFLKWTCLSWIALDMLDIDVGGQKR
jgi:hypothetical protein